MAFASIPVDWNLAQQPSSLNFTPDALQGMQAGQQMRQISALQGIDINDPDSLNKGITNLVRAGGAEQASALMGLGINRALYQQLPGWLSQATSMTTPPGAPGAAPQAPLTGAPATGASPQPPMTQDQMGAGTSGILAQAQQDAANLAKLPPDQQQAALPGLREKYIGMGVPPGAVDQALSHIQGGGDPNELAAYYGAHAGAANGQMPQGGLPSSPYQPSYEWAQNYLNHPQWSMMEAMLKSRFGLDLGLTGRAQAIMGPEFNQEAAVRNAQALATQQGLGSSQFELSDVTLPSGAHMQVPKNMALAMGEGGALVGPTPGALAAQTAAGTAAGEAPAKIATLNLPGGGTQQGSYTPNSDGSYTFHPIKAEGVTTGAPGGAAGAGRSPDIGTQENLRGQADALNTASTQAGSRLPHYPQAIANAQSLMAVANTVGTGAYTQALARASQALQPFGAPQEFAANAGLLGQRLAGSFKDALQGLPVPRITSEAKAITGAIPKSTSPQDQVKFYAAGNLAATQYQQDYDRFVTAWAADSTKPRDLSAANAAWAAGPGNKSIFSEPAWSGVSVGGQPAVIAFTNRSGQRRIAIGAGLFKTPIIEAP